MTLANVRASEVLGLIVNVPSESFGLFGAQHWMALRRFPDGHWFLLDSSHKPGPRHVPDVSDRDRMLDWGAGSTSPAQAVVALF